VLGRLLAQALDWAAKGSGQGSSSMNTCSRIESSFCNGPLVLPCTLVDSVRFRVHSHKRRHQGHLVGWGLVTASGTELALALATASGKELAGALATAVGRELAQVLATATGSDLGGDLALVRGSVALHRWDQIAIQRAVETRGGQATARYLTVLGSPRFQPQEAKSLQPLWNAGGN